MRLTVNGQVHEIDVVHDDTPLLWVLRDHLGLVGTKFGCGIGQCGACTVLVGGAPTFSCMVPAAALQDGDIRTIEGLAGPDGTLHPLQRVWIERDVAQCGYCQSGQIMRAAALLDDIPRPSAAAVDEALAPGICRCGTYQRIREAVLAAAGVTDEG
jgi:isoquinoline 1-oxidoreductase subunit alpha